MPVTLPRRRTETSYAQSDPSVLQRHRSRARQALGRIVCLLAIAAPASAFTADGSRLLASDGQPIAVRGLWYPLDARRDGQPVKPDELVAQAVASRVNLLGLRVIEGPCLDEAAQVLAAAAARGLAVAVEPSPGEGDAARRIAARLRGSPALQVWCATEPASAPDGCLALASAGPLEAPDGPVLFRSPALFQGAQSFGRWAAPMSQQRAGGRLVVANLEAAPPDWLVTARLLRDDAPHPDLYRSGEARPQTAAALGGEYLLVPEPAQVRLQAYAALGRGARGVFWDHAGHFAVGPGPHSGAARAAELSRLYTELSWLAPFIAAGELLPEPVAPPGTAAGLHKLGERHLLLVWRDRRLDTRAVGGPAPAPLTIELPLELPANSRALRLTVSGLVDEPADIRGEQVRVTLPDFDLTAAVILAPQPAPGLAKAVEDELPQTARRAMVIASLRWQQVAETIQALEAHQAAAGGRGLMAVAAGLLDEAKAAYRSGYLRSCIERACQADGAVREAQAVELEAALAHRLAGERADALRLCFPSLPALFAPRDHPPTGPYPLSPESPLRSDLATVSSRWTALAGFDQTVATLRPAAGHLVWTPAPDEPGALYLPFEAHHRLRLTVQVQVDSLRRDRLLGLASHVYGPALALLRWQPDGTVTGPRGQASWEPATWHTLVWEAGDGGLQVRFDEHDLGRVALPAPVGALVLAVVAGDGEEPMGLRELAITVPQ